MKEKQTVYIFYLHEDFVSKFLERELGRGPWPGGSVSIDGTNINGDYIEIYSFLGLNGISVENVDRVIVEKKLINSETKPFEEKMRKKENLCIEIYDYNKL